VPALETLGWDDAWNVAFEPFCAEGLEPGRVAVPHRGAYDVLTRGGEVRARLAGRLRQSLETSDLPVVGDWVALGEKDEIVGVLPRRSKFSRRAPHEPDSDSVREQVVAANVDVVLVTFPLGGDLDPLLLERYVTLALESGARPVILLTKSDLESDLDAVAAELADVGGEIPVHTISAREGLGLDTVRGYLSGGVTGALLGPSGSGKSTLVNSLAGDADLLATGRVRDDGTGRHTTTRRQLVLLPDGGLVIDNPGMREVHLWLADEGLEEAFEDIVELGAECRFSDCRHEVEPGCAVLDAVAAGQLSSERWQRFLALRREVEELEERLLRRERSRARRGRPGAEGS
jgi:ribosome biogenesis GTPase